jgi:SAM-dependent methyltransferase
MGPDLPQDRVMAGDDAYADSGRLMARASIYAYDESGFELLPWVLGHVPWPVDGLVLDVGCGPGRYLAETGGGIGLDLSLGMVREAGAVDGVLGVQGDAAALPAADGSIARILAPHMLYHVPEPARAVAEWRRVLRSGGEAVVVLNDAGHLAELRAHAEGQVEALLTDEAIPLLEAVFDEVEVHPHVGRLLVTDAAAVTAYVDSTGRPSDRARDWAQAEIDVHDHVEIHSRFSTLVAR